MENKIYTKILMLIIAFLTFQFGNAQSDFYYTFNNSMVSVVNNPNKKVLFSFPLNKGVNNLAISKTIGSIDYNKSLQITRT